MATIDLGEGNKFIITKTHEELEAMLEELRELEKKYPPFEIKEIKLPECKEEDHLIEIEQKTIEPKKTKKRLRIKRKQKKHSEKTFTDEGPEFIELETVQKQDITQKQDMIDITKETQPTVCQPLPEWEEIKLEQTIQTEVETLDLKPESTIGINKTETHDIESDINPPSNEKNLEISETKKHRESILPSTNIKLIIDEEGNLALADKPKNIIKKKVKTEIKKKEKIKKFRLKDIIPHRKKRE